MPWCPKCKNEYREGVTTCADCKIALVDSLDEISNEIDPKELAVMKHKDAVIRLVKYLRYSGIESVDVQADSETRTYHVLVDSSALKEALKHYRAFLSVEEQFKNAKQTAENTTADAADSDTEVYVRSGSDSMSEPEELISSEDSADTEFMELIDFDEMQEPVSQEPEDVPSKAPSSSRGAYVKKADAYKDNHSTGTMFLAFSILGFVFVGLNIAGIITYINGLFSYIVMSALFVGFFLLGIYSLKRAKEVSGDIDAETKMTEDINAYLDSLGDLSSLDETDWKDLSDEVLYFKRTNRMKEMITAKFGSMDENYLDCIVEEYYNSHM